MPTCSCQFNSQSASDWRVSQRTDALWGMCLARNISRVMVFSNITRKLQLHPCGKEVTNLLNTPRCQLAAVNSQSAKGTWLHGFSYNLQNVSITVDELMRLREGHALASERGYERVEVETDSEVIVKLIKEENVEFHPLGNIIRDCQNFLRLPWDISVGHTLREGNRCADALGKLGHSVAGLQILEEPPVKLLDILMGFFVFQPYLMGQLVIIPKRNNYKHSGTFLHKLGRIV